MPTLDVSELNVVIAVLGIFTKNQQTYEQHYSPEMQGRSLFSMDSYRSRSSRCGTWEKPVCTSSLNSVNLDRSLTCIVPAVLIGIILGPIASKFLDSERWGSAVEGQTEAITLVRPPSGSGVCHGLLTFKTGHVSRRHWRPTGHCRIPAPSKISAA